MAFRDWLEVLRETRGARPLWPVLLGRTLDEEFRRQVAIRNGYRGKQVCIFRDGRRYAPGGREERQVADLFHLCLETSSGCLNVGGRPIWLLGFQWPNQGKYRGRRADLIGLAPDGGLVVFECKLEKGEAPLTALIEGLDYLVCLLRQENFQQIVEFVPELKRRRRGNVAEQFLTVEPSATVRPSLVVLAPESYFCGRNLRSIRGKEWLCLAAVGEHFIPSVGVLFAVTDYKSPSARLARCDT
jgi:hypothetical protein